MTWQIMSHRSTDKSFKVKGPGDVTLTVDYDDVDQRSVDREIIRMVEILNDMEPGGRQTPTTVLDKMLQADRELSGSLDKAIQGWEMLKAFFGAEDTEETVMIILRRVQQLLHERIGDA